MSNGNIEATVPDSPRTFEFDGTPYVGTWSEDHRYQCELRELAMMSPGDLSDQIERIRSKRGQEAAQKAHIDATQKRRDLVASGDIPTTKPKVRPQGSGLGANRSGHSSVQHSGRPQSGPFF